MSATAVSPAANGAKTTIDLSQPYLVDITIEGAADLLFHAWNVEAVAAKAGAAKGSKAKKTDDVESYVYRDDDGLICLPGTYLRSSIINAAKFRQDPRSPRKSAMDLFKAGVVAITALAPVISANGKPTKAWDFEHRCRMVVQRSAITRTFPAFKVGWRSTVRLMVALPQYIAPQVLNETVTDAGRLIGVGDLRPTYGRFVIKSFDIAFAD